MTRVKIVCLILAALIGVIITLADMPITSASVARRFYIIRMGNRTKADRNRTAEIPDWWGNV